VNSSTTSTESFRVFLRCKKKKIFGKNEKTIHKKPGKEKTEYQKEKTNNKKFKNKNTTQVTFHEYHIIETDKGKIDQALKRKKKRQ